MIANTLENESIYEKTAILLWLRFQEKMAFAYDGAP